MGNKMMRIAGRTSGGTAVPMLADDNGNIGTIRKWKKTTSVLVDNLQIRDTNSHDADFYDLSSVPQFSLRILNTTETPLTLNLLTDMSSTQSRLLTDIDGASLSLTIQPTTNHVVITPDDWPIMNYIKALRLRIKAGTAPESGSVYVYIVTET